MFPKFDYSSAQHRKKKDNTKKFKAGEIPLVQAEEDEEELSNGMKN